MGLLELCEPLFLEVCRINRSTRKGGPAFDPQRERVKIRAIFEEMGEAAAGNPDLTEQYQKVRRHLLFFADGLMAECMPKWANLAEEEKPPLYGGGSDFFRGSGGLEDTLADPSHSATERLSIFYTCLGLGFTGEFKEDPDYIQRKINEAVQRLHGSIDMTERKHEFEQAYKNVDTRELEVPVKSSLVGVTIVMLGLIVIVLVFNWVSYYENTKDLKAHVHHVIDYFKTH
ncbi:MAG: DotU family type IV/VI secretion system protein [Tepidisphaeraceae bacterium]|jgi:type VI secretion system protein ImpK